MHDSERDCELTGSIIKPVASLRLLGGLTLTPECDGYLSVVDSASVCHGLVACLIFRYNMYMYVSCVQWWPCYTESAGLNARLFLDSSFCGQCTNGIGSMCCILNLEPSFSSPSCTVCAESICSALTEMAVSEL